MPVCVGGSAEVVETCLGAEVGSVAVGDRDVVLRGGGSGEGLDGVDALFFECVLMRRGGGKRKEKSRQLYVP